jgi:3-hydroxyisobutyrate dehydrogenase
MRIAFIGLGAMGRPMATHLLAQGFDLRVNDTNADLAKNFGAAWAPSPSEATRGAEAVITMLPNGHIVRDVILGSGGVADAMGSGGIVVDTSSSDAGGTIALGAELKARGIALIDAPVSGGVPLAAEGKLTLMVGGTDDGAFAKVQPLLAALSAKLMRVGGLGAGHAAKAINNAIAAAIFAVTSEGVDMGARFGLHAATLLEVINASSGRSGISEGLFPSQVLPRKFDLGFGLPLMAKDVALADKLREELGLTLPMIETTHRQMQAALAAMGNHADFTDYFRFNEKAASAA